MNDLQGEELAAQKAADKAVSKEAKDAEKKIRRALVELAVEAPVDHVELKHHVARRQSHLRHIRHVPCVHDDAP